MCPGLAVSISVLCDPDLCVPSCSHLPSNLIQVWPGITSKVEWWYASRASALLQCRPSKVKGHSEFHVASSHLPLLPTYLIRVWPGITSKLKGHSVFHAASSHLPPHQPTSLEWGSVVSPEAAAASAAGSCPPILSFNYFIIVTILLIKTCFIIILATKQWQKCEKDMTDLCNKAQWGSEKKGS